jgi:multidrug efflux pump subunit AcrA (membrane-fusion protein)
MYATITMKIQERPQVLAIPVEAVKGDKVFVVNANHELEERQIKLGLETPDKYEVLSGLNEGDLVVVGKSASLHAGEKIEPKVIELSMTSGL